jgi:hypothetical protein
LVSSCLFDLIFEALPEAEISLEIVGEPIEVADFALLDDTKEDSANLLDGLFVVLEDVDVATFEFALGFPFVDVFVSDMEPDTLDSAASLGLSCLCNSNCC